MTKARDIASATPAPSTVSSAELGYLDGVTSAIQTQVDAKLATATASTTYVPNTLTTTTGDIIYASGADTPARLAVGSTDDVLTVAGGVPTWAAPSSGGMTLLSTTTLTGTSTTISSISQDFIDLVVIIKEANNDANANFRLQLNTDTGSNYYSGISGVKGSTAILDTSDGYSGVFVAQAPANTATVVEKLFGKIYISRYTDTDITFGTTSCQYRTTTAVATTNGCFIYDNTAAIDSITLYPQSGSWTSGTVYIYGVK
jgi:hypothetical protein